MVNNDVNRMPDDLNPQKTHLLLEIYYRQGLLELPD